MTGNINIPMGAIDSTSLPVGAFYGRKSGSTYSIPTSGQQYMVNSEYFSFISDSADANYGKFLCKKSFTGNVNVLATGNLSAAGDGNVWTYLHYKMYIDDTLIASETANVNYKSVAYTSQNFTAGKYTYIQGYNYGNSKSGTADFTMVISL